MEWFKDVDSKNRFSEQYAWFSEQSAWEEHQIRKAKLQFGSKDRKRCGVGDYESV